MATRDDRDVPKGTVTAIFVPVILPIIDGVLNPKERIFLELLDAAVTVTV